VNSPLIPKLHSIQILRAVAAISVVVCHLEVGFGEFGVDIFFIISGFVISLVIQKNTSLLSFAIDRLARIVPLYWLLTTTLFVFISIAPHLVHETTAVSASFSNFLKSLFFIPFYSGGLGLPDLPQVAWQLKPLLSPGWTLNFEVFFYFIVSIFLAITRRPLMATAATLFSFFIAFNQVGEDVIRRTFYGSELFLFFIFGMIAFYIFSKGFLKLLNPFYLIFTAVASYLVMAIVQSENLVNYIESNHVVGGRLLLYGLPAFFLVLASVGLEHHIVHVRTFIISFLCSVGNASYATYLTHWFVIVFSRKILSEREQLYDFYSPFGAIITLFFALIVGQITYFFVDRHLHRKLRSFLRSKLLRLHSG
jgi:exopolysaccharide production protein ExoZ